jgi:hypothetical protein
MRLFLLSLVVTAGLRAQRDSYWPDQQWRTARPETQGIDSQALGAVLEEVHEKRLGVHSLLVIRHGYAVLNASFLPGSNRIWPAPQWTIGLADTCEENARGSVESNDSRVIHSTTPFSP